MPLPPVVHQHAPAGHPQPASAVDADMPYPRPHDLRSLRRGAHLDEIEMLAPRIVAAHHGFPVPVTGGDPQMAGCVPGKIPRPVVGPAGGEDRAHAAAIQADDPQGRCSQPCRARRIGHHVVHPPYGPAPDLRRAFHAPSPVEPADSRSRQHMH